MAKVMAKRIKVGDMVVAKNGEACEVTVAERFTDRGFNPHKQVMVLAYKIPVEPGIATSVFPLRFKVEIAEQ